MEIVTQTVGNITGKMGDYVFGEVGKQFGYLINYHTHVTTLEVGARNLKAEREELRRRTEAATRNLEQIETKVENWFKEVNPLISETDNFLEADRARNNHRCFNERCINLWSRYKFGKEAFKKATEITKHNHPKFESVSHPVAPSEIKPISSKMFLDFESRESTVKNIMEALDDERVKAIGICGMGGVGKTTIVDEVRRRAEERKLFDAVAMVVMSQTPILSKIQDGIAHKLGLNLEVRGELDRAPTLWERIKREKKMLIILDDVWSWLELKEVGIPLGEDHPGCKIVLTSRSEDACKEMNAQKIFRIEILNEREAWKLFKEMVGETVNHSSEMNSMAREIAKGCGGLPLAIVTIGRALKNRSKEIWDDAFKQLKKPIPAANIKGMEPFLYSRLKLSYDYLEGEEAKSVFLLCSLFSEDASISIERLLLYGIGLELFKDVDTIEDARVRTNALVRYLISSFLLLEDHKPRSLLEGHNSRFVKMHDIIRDVAILIASEDKVGYLIKAGSKLASWPHNDIIKKYKGISFTRNNIGELPDELECSQLQILLLNEQKTGNELMKIPTNFFGGMKDLKVLNMSKNNIESLPASVAKLATIRTLVLMECKLIGDISIIGTLKQLEILDLSSSGIESVPANFSGLTLLRYFDLSNNPLKQVPQGVLSNLGKLEELYIDSFRHWSKEGEENPRNGASLVELKSLSRLTHLFFDVEIEDRLPSNFNYQNLTRFAIRIGLPSPVTLASWNKVVHFVGYKGRLISTVGVKVLVKATESLVLAECHMETMVQGEGGDNNDFDELKQLFIFFCRGMKYVVDWAPTTPRVPVFQKLEILELHGLENFIGIWSRQILPLPTESFSKLRRLLIVNCPIMEAVVVLEDGDDQKGLEEKEMIMFPHLYRISLWNLTSLTCFCKSSHQYALKYPSLQEVTIMSCPKMETFFHGVLITPKLKKVQVDKEIWMGDLNATVQHNFKVQSRIIKLERANNNHIISKAGRRYLSHIFQSIQQTSKFQGVSRKSWISLPTEQSSRVNDTFQATN